MPHLGEPSCWVWAQQSGVLPFHDIFIHSTVDGVLGCFLFFALCIKFQWTFSYLPFSTHVYMFLLGVYRTRGRTCLTSVGDTSFPKCRTPFRSHQQPWELHLPLILSSTWCWRSSSFQPFWGGCDSHQWQVGLSVSACAGYPWARPSGEEATQAFSYLLTEILCMFWTQSPWSFVCIADIFSHSAACLSTSSMVSFNKQEFLISMWSNLSTFSYG